MSGVDTLLALLVENDRNIPERMRAAGFGEDQLREAWEEARRLGFTESTGLGQDPLTEAGITKAREL